MKPRFKVGSKSFATPFDFDMALLVPVWSIMQTGIRVNRDILSEFQTEYMARWEKDQENLDRVCGQALNVYSPKQVMGWLYDDLGLPTRYRKGRPTSEEEALRALLAHTAEKVRALKTDAAKSRYLRAYLSLMLILKVRTTRKRLSSYLGFHIKKDVIRENKKFLDSDGRMRFTLSVGGTETFRFSCSKSCWRTGCNMQTIPKELRRMFIADEGMELAELDLNRGESWVYAHLSEDPELMRIHLNGGDFHAETAAAFSLEFGERLSPAEIRALSKEYERGNKEDRFKMGFRLRYMGKRVNHASAYRMGPVKGAEVVNEEADDTGITITSSQYKRLQEIWRQKYIRIPQWWKEIEHKLGSDRTLVTPFGRERTFFERWGDELFKEATAYVPQSTSVDYLNVGMLNTFDNLNGFRGLQLLHQNHDSILVQYEAGYRDEVLPRIIDHMTHVIEVKGYDVTIPIEAGYGQSWGELTEWKAAA